MKPVCSACGTALGPPEQSIYDPDEGLDNEDAHLNAKDGDKGKRLYCSESGQVAKVEDEETGDVILTASGKQPEGGGSGGSSAPQKSPPKQQSGGGQQQAQQSPNRGGGKQRNQRTREEVYEIEEDTEAIDILRDVVTNPSYELNDSQINEVEDWAEIYDGQIPPDTLEDVLKSLSGVSAQKAKLIRQKYEAKLNKWVREESAGDGGPPIGSVHMPQPNLGKSNSSSGGPSPAEIKRKLKEKKEQRDGSNDSQPSESSGTKNRRGGTSESQEFTGRKRRQIRRQRAADAVVDEMAHEMAQQMAQNMGRGYDFIFTLLESKASKDPDWFFEKAEAFDIDVFDDFMEPSNALQEEISSSGGKSKTDKLLEQGVESVKAGDGGQTKSQERTHSGESGPQTTNNPTPSETNEATTEQDQKEEFEERTENEGPHFSNEDYQDEEETFEEIFGDL